MSYSKCKYWKLAHHEMNCKNCMVPNKEYCKEKFYNADNVNQKIEWLEEAIEILENDKEDNFDDTRRIMSEDYD